MVGEQTAVFFETDNAGWLQPLFGNMYNISAEKGLGVFM